MKTDPMDGAKKCKTCGILKPISSYTRDKTYRDGLKNECRSCYHNSEVGRKRMDARIAAMRYET